MRKQRFEGSSKGKIKPDGSSKVKPNIEESSKRTNKPTNRAQTDADKFLFGDNVIISSPRTPMITRLGKSSGTLRRRRRRKRRRAPRRPGRPPTMMPRRDLTSKACFELRDTHLVQHP